MIAPNTTAPDRPPDDVIDALWAELVAEVQRILRTVEAEEGAAITPLTEDSEHDEHD